MVASQAVADALLEPLKAHVTTTTTNTVGTTATTTTSTTTPTTTTQQQAFDPAQNPPKG